MESTRPIRALVRGLDALALLNLRNGATVSEVAQEIRLPRTTTYRILETLSQAGYLYRDEADDRYRLTIRVHCLSDGFDDEAWVTQIARPRLQELGAEILWPVALASLSGTSMMIRATTDHSSPLAIDRFTAGSRLPLLTSACGRAYLAFCPPEQRESLVEMLERSPREEDRLARNRAELHRLIEEIRARGYASATRPRRVCEEVTMAVPVPAGEGVLATMSVRFSSTAVPVRVAVERFLPRLRETANRIRQTFAEERRNAALRRMSQAASP